MLESLEIKNFKSYKDVTVSFGLITTITGGNNSGKTNILRALKLILHHTDWPTSWIRHGENEASIVLTLTNGTIVKRTRNLKTQTVSITKDGETTSFTGKKDASQWVQDAIGIRKVTLDEVTGPEDLNFTDVFDGPYLTGRYDTIQRKITGVVGANKIEEARISLLNKAKALKVQTTGLDKTIAGSKESISSLKVFVKNTKELLEEVKNTNQIRHDLEKSLENLNSLRKHKDEYTSFIYTHNVVGNISENLAKIQQYKGSIEELEKQLGILRKAQEFRKTVNKEVTSNAKSIKSTLDTFRTLYSEYNSCSKVSTSIKELKWEIHLGAIKVQDEKANLDLINSERERLVKELGVCPLCGK